MHSELQRNKNNKCVYNKIKYANWNHRSFLKIIYRIIFDSQVLAVQQTVWKHENKSIILLQFFSLLIFYKRHLLPTNCWYFVLSSYWFVSNVFGYGEQLLDNLVFPHWKIITYPRCFETFAHCQLKMSNFLKHSILIANHV